MLGFNLCFFPMHYLGMCGLPRRVCVYDPSFAWINNIMSLGALISVVSGFFLVFVLWESLATKNLVFFA